MINSFFIQKILNNLYNLYLGDFVSDIWISTFSYPHYHQIVKKYLGVGVINIYCIKKFVKNPENHHLGIYFRLPESTTHISIKLL